MSDIKSKVSYLKGLADGKNLKEKGVEGDILFQLIGLVDEMAGTIESLETQVEEVSNFKDDFLKDLNNIDKAMTDFLHGLADSDLIDVDEMEDFDDFEDDEDLYEVTCAKCGNEYLADFDDFLDDNVVCPVCGTAYDLTDDILLKIQESDHNHD